MLEVARRLLLLFAGLFLLLPVSFLFFLHLVSATLRQDVVLTCNSLCLSRSCLASCRCPAVSACVCVSRSFSALFLPCAAPRVYRFLFAKAASILQQLLCSMLKLHGRFLHMFLELSPTRYRVAFPSRSCNLTPKLLPCFMMGSVCPVHALYVWACAC